MTKRLLSIFVAILIIFGLRMSGQILSVRMEAGYLDTLTIKNPIIVKKDGIGYIANKSKFNPERPMDITKSIETSLVIISPVKSSGVVFDDFVPWVLRYDLAENLKKKGIYEFYRPKFNYVDTYQGCEVYEYPETEILVSVLVIQIRSVNMMLNPKIEWGNPVQTWEREIKSEYPALEYVRVAFPIKGGKPIDDSHIINSTY